MAKKIDGYIKLQIPAGQANPSPPVGPALGQKGVNIMEFCKAFNANTQKLEQGMPIPVVITVYQDKSFSFETKSPPVSFFIKKALKLKKALPKYIISDQGASDGSYERSSKNLFCIRKRAAES